MQTENSVSKKRDLFLILILLAAAAILGGGFYLTHRTPALRAEITVDGKGVAILDMSKDQEYTVQGPHGGTNHLIIENGEIWCDNASCPDKVCVHQGKQSRDDEIIVCLPNLMIVQVIGEE